MPAILTPAADAPARIALREQWGWTRWVDKRREVWFKGHVRDGQRALCGAAAAAWFADRLEGSTNSVAAELRAADGHFAVVLATPGRIVAAVDRIRSTPLFHANVAGTLVLDSDARSLLQALPDKTRDRDAGLEVALAGYTIGPSTLYTGLRQLEAGSVLVAEASRVAIRRYYVYDAWLPPVAHSRERRKADLVATFRTMFEALARDAGGRPLFVPLSGGLDSRLIACGLAEVGYRNVVCFAYGRPGNFEAAKSRSVADVLGYQWHFVPYTPHRVRTYLQSEEYAAHVRMADSCASVPFLQDLFAVSSLRARGLVPHDAIFVNGQSGDFITGNHIPASLHRPAEGLPAPARRQRIVDALVTKHFALWRDLRAPDRLARIRARMDARIDAAGIPEIPAGGDHGVYEALEFQERQAKFVVSGQRVYEFFGYDWRLPLWDAAFCDFWARMPLADKVEQSMFREVLSDLNWGRVWRPLLPERMIVPRWMHYVRAAASLPVKALAGPQVWREVDRRVFGHASDTLCVMHCVPYWRALSDRRGFRHGVSFRAEAYLHLHGLGNDGETVIGPPPGEPRRGPPQTAGK